MSNRNDATASGSIGFAVAAPKHSGHFYISNSVFRNKRLKKKRLMWQARFSGHSTYTRRSKTDGHKRNRLANRQADVTIDLLSDDDDDVDDDGYQGKNATTTISAHSLQHYIVLPANYQLSDVPNVTFMPVQKPTTSPQLNRAIARRKSQPKRFDQATIVNDESIVLTDDDDDELEQHRPPISNSRRSDVQTISNGGACKQSLSPQKSPVKRQSTPKKALQPKMTPPKLSAHVDDEVTVSIVPRSSTAGSCKPKNTTDEAFPMLPDETTVHTVIANRTYELSLTKLREGLASCELPEHEDGAKQTAEATTNNPKQRRRKNQAAPIKQPQQQQQTPISLKLSSDLSISLISDDEDDGCHDMNGIGGGYELLNNNQDFDSALIMQSSSQVPRRRKLG